ncbi:MAG: hypothetical protein V2A65_01785 [Candidatus Omnitrophota bacterium]
MAKKGKVQGGIKEGRMPKADIVAQCKRWAPELIQQLYQIATIKNTKNRNKLHAIQELLDRAYGKPKETVDTGVTIVWDISSKPVKVIEGKPVAEIPAPAEGDNR